jgi:four helix bundle protein
VCGVPSWLRAKVAFALLAPPAWVRSILRNYGLATRASAEAGGRPRNSCEASRANALFAHFTPIARASLKETQNHVLDARDQSIIGEEEFTHLWQLSDDALASTTALLKYLIGPK